MFSVELGPPALALGVRPGFPVISIPTSTPIGMPGHSWQVGSTVSPTRGNPIGFLKVCCLSFLAEGTDRLAGLFDPFVRCFFVIRIGHRTMHPQRGASDRVQRRCQPMGCETMAGENGACPPRHGIEPCTRTGRRSSGRARAAGDGTSWSAGEMGGCKLGKALVPASAGHGRRHVVACRGLGG